MLLIIFLTGAHLISILTFAGDLMRSSPLCLMANSAAKTARSSGDSRSSVRSAPVERARSTYEGVLKTVERAEDKVGTVKSGR